MTRWERVAEAIRQRIRDGQVERRGGGQYLPAYDRLEAELKAEGYRLSYGSLRRAVIELRHQGWIESEPGVGLRVRPDHPA